MCFKASHPVPWVPSPLSRREVKTWEGAQQAFAPDRSLQGELYVWAQTARTLSALPGLDRKVAKFKAEYMVPSRRKKESEHENLLDLREEIEIHVNGILYPDSDDEKAEKSEQGWPREENA